MPILIWLPIVLGLISREVMAASSGGLQLVIFVGAGLLFWGILEYILHLYLFHPPENWEMLCE